MKTPPSPQSSRAAVRGLRTGTLAVLMGLIAACGGNKSTPATTTAVTTYLIGGSISGLTSPGLVLTDNGSDALTIAPGATSFTFPTALDTNVAFSALIKQQPTGQTCQILSGTGAGTVGTVNVSTIQITCLSPWIWQNGDTTGNLPGVFPAGGFGFGVPSARDSAAHWTDSTGHFWMFGGEGVDANGVYGYLNDLWEYTPGSGWLTAGWKRVSGGSSANGAPGSYVAQGANAGNWPGARAGAICWTDSSGNFWMFGGHGFDSTMTSTYLNDLWEYSPGSGWSWVGGPSIASTSSANYPASPGVVSAQSLPGGRASGVSWVDPANHLWLMGGDGYDSTGALGALNDLWEFVPGSGWIWVAGANTVSALGSYGSAGNPTNAPGARYDSVSWTDVHGNFWLFGGYGFGTTAGAGKLNDLWEYLPASGQWNFINGSKTTEAAGAYGSEGTAAAANVPGSRYSATTWVDTSGNLWLFGGYGIDSSGTPGGLNDLWEYSISTGQWAWISGSNLSDALGQYGILNTASIGTSPGARYGSMPWTDTEGNLWQFGGYGIDAIGDHYDLNDLWEFQP